MQKVMMTTPETSLLLETDSPYSVPKPLSTEVNEPANIWTIAETMAKLRQVSIERINRVATDNAIRIFNIKN
jgi:TatD DNase family protein